VAARTPPRNSIPRLVWLLTLLAGAFHLLAARGHPLWTDEACSYFTIQQGALAILDGDRSAGTPPLYFVVLWAFSQLAGTSELALRLPSMIAATAMVPLGYLAGARYASARAGLFAAFAFVVSPLVHYYAIEARNYALLQLEMLLLLIALHRALERRGQPRDWLAVAALLTAILYTHNYGLFVLPSVVLAAIVAGGNEWRRAGAGAAAAVAIAFVAYLPFFWFALQHASSAVTAWLIPFWESAPAVLQLLSSLALFGVGAQYPDYLPELAAAPSLVWVGLALSLLLPALALLPHDARRSAATTSEPAATIARPGAVLLVLALAPLVVALAYSQLIDPIYLPGRYDTVALPAFLLLYAVGLERLSRIHRRLWVGPMLVIGVAALALMSNSTAFRAPAESPYDSAAEVLAERAEVGDLVVATGYGRCPFEYALDRSGLELEIASFPAELARHPGWYSERSLLDQPAQLEADAAALASWPGGVWVGYSEFEQVDAHLYRALREDRSPDIGRSHRELRLARFTPARANRPKPKRAPGAR